eukprot:gene5991-7040_t
MRALEEESSACPLPPPSGEAASPAAAAASICVALRRKRKFAEEFYVGQSRNGVQYERTSPLQKHPAKGPCVREQRES